MPKSQSRKKAFSLIELVMVIVIAGILVGTFSLYVQDVIKLWHFLRFRNEVVAQARLGLMRMTRPIRRISGSTSISIAYANKLQFIDVDNSSLYTTFNCPGAGLPLYLEYGPYNANILISQLNSNAIFTYYNSAGAALATPVSDPSQIKKIKITLQVRSGDQTETFSTQVAPRNLNLSNY